MVNAIGFPNTYPLDPSAVSLRSRRLEVVGERENGRARGRHARGEGASPLACLLLARPLFLVPTTTSSKRLLSVLLATQAKRCTRYPAFCNLDCSQSPIFSSDRLGIPRLTATAILIFKCTEGAGVGDYSSR